MCQRAVFLQRAQGWVCYPTVWPRWPGYYEECARELFFLQRIQGWVCYPAVRLRRARFPMEMWPGGPFFLRRVRTGGHIECESETLETCLLQSCCSESLMCTESCFLLRVWTLLPVCGKEGTIVFPAGLSVDCFWTRESGYPD